MQYAYLALQLRGGRGAGRGGPKHFGSMRNHEGSTGDEMSDTEEEITIRRDMHLGASYCEVEVQHGDVGHLDPEAGSRWRSVECLLEQVRALEIGDLFASLTGHGLSAG